MNILVPIRAGTLLSVILLSACTSLSKQVYVASDTSLGVNGAVNTAQTAGKLVIGYDRKFVAYVPKIIYEGDSDVMAVYNCTHLEVQGLRIKAFKEHLATGDAAKMPGKPATRPDCNPAATPVVADAASGKVEGGSHEN